MVSSSLTNSCLRCKQSLHSSNKEEEEEVIKETNTFWTFISKQKTGLNGMKLI